MEDEINLKPYLLALLRNRLLIISIGIICAAAVTLYPLVSSPLNAYTAKQSLVIVTPITKEQQQTIAELLNSDVVRININNMLGEPRGTVTISMEQNLINIVAISSTEEDAQQLAKIWSESIQKLLTQIYAKEDPRSIAELEQQLQENQALYVSAQAALEAFIAEGEINSTTQEIRRLSDLTESLRSSTFSRLNEYLARQREIEFILRDARILRDRLAAEAGSTIANSTAALLLSIRNSSLQSNQLTLQIDSSITAGSAITVEEIDRLIESLEREYLSVSTEINQLKDEAISEQLRDLNDQLTRAQIRLEKLNSRQRDLINERDQALNRINQLRQRIQELRNPATTIVFRIVADGVSTSMAATDRVSLRNVLVAGIIGLILASAFVVGREVIRNLQLEVTSRPESATE